MRRKGELGVPVIAASVIKGSGQALRKVLIVLWRIVLTISEKTK